MPKRVAILQSAYIPWKGYFDLIHSVDEFILYDSVQYTHRDWRNRNRIKTHDGVNWLTIPVTSTSRDQKINQTIISDASWAQRHWRTWQHAYARAPFFEHYSSELAALYSAAGNLQNLSEVNLLFLTAICRYLGITTPITRDTQYELAGDKSQRLANLCRQAGADIYLSGPAARAYLDETAFAALGVQVRWADYSGYPEYPQLHGPFDHQVSILDLLFSTGPAARQYMKASLISAERVTEQEQAC